jgi:predicted DNA-binding transcriptional regulator AlpA
MRMDVGTMKGRLPETVAGQAIDVAGVNDRLPPELAPHRVVSRRQLAEITGLSEATHERLDARGEGPRAIRLSARRLGYRLSDVLAWLEARGA